MVHESQTSAALYSIILAKKQSCFSIAATWVVSRELPREAVKARVQLADYQN